MNAILPLQERGASRSALRPPLRIEMGLWLPRLAASQRIMAERRTWGDPAGNAGFLARARENEEAAAALLRGAPIAAIRKEVQALREGQPCGGQLGDILNAIEEQESRR